MHTHTRTTWGLKRSPVASDNERTYEAHARERRPVADAEACTATVASSTVSASVRVCYRVEDIFVNGLTPSIGSVRSSNDAKNVPSTVGKLIKL